MSNSPKDKIDNVSFVLSILNYELYSTIRLYLNGQLLSYQNAKDVNTWRKQQLANSVRVKNKIQTLQIKQQHKINKVIKRAEEVLGYKPKLISTKNVVPLMTRQYKKDINTIFTKVRRTNIDDLKQAIYKYTNSEVKPPSVVYSDDRTMNWHSYMEMNVRTTLNNDLVEMKIESSDGLKNIFYVFDHFSDCAPDHIDYQDKVYYGENIEYDEEAQKYISENGLVSYESIVNGEPYMERRPNCRHEAKRITYEELVGDYKQKVVNRGRDYEATQQQRANERQIRKYKERLANDKLQNHDTSHNQALVSKWQKIQRELVESENLKRDYRREQVAFLVQDLGVRYENII